MFFVFIYIILSCLLVSLISLVAIFFLFLKKPLQQKAVLYLVALSAGALMGGAFLHLLPEAANSLSPNTLYPLILFSFIGFFLIEKVFYWRHCHKINCTVHSFGYMNLLGDAIHNFIDGLVIAAAFLTNLHLGLITLLAVILHEIPQELGDFGVLLQAGFSKTKALLFNFLTALLCVLGGVSGYFLGIAFNKISLWLLPITAGGFIYIAASDLLPELNQEKYFKKSFGLFFAFLFGILIMYLAGFIG